MANYCDGLRLLWLPGLASVKKKPKFGVQHWLDNGTYAVRSLASKDSISLDGVDRFDFSISIAADINRLASAGHETLLNVVRGGGMPRSAAWPLVKVYYSALYHAHALMRLWGLSITYLHPHELFKLKRVASAYQIAEVSKFKKGQYALRYERTDGNVTLSTTSGNGTHDALWRSLQAALSEVQNAVAISSLITTGDKSEIVRQVQIISSAISRAQSNAAWLSATRNAIQYRQELGVWFPYAGNFSLEVFAEKIELAMTGSAPIDSFDCGSQNDVVAFSESCLLLISTVCGALNDLYAASSENSFLKYGPKRVEQTFGGP